MRKILLSAAAALAFFSCSGDIDDMPPLGGKVTLSYSSSSWLSSSSSSRPSSSSSSSEGSYIVNNIDNYRTVQIGNQFWMAENLNYYVANSKCYDNNPANCEKYGRLYNWTTAIKVCPSGWHLPTNAEWDALFRYVDGDNSISSPYDSDTAGRYLKAASGWNNGGNGLNTYEFAALPGGRGNYYGSFSFSNVGNLGYWWSVSEYDDSHAYLRFMSYEYERAGFNYYDKSGLFSVRCVQD